MKEGKSDLWNIIDLLKRVIFGAFVVIITIVGIFVFYLMKQVDNDVITTIDTTGVYNLVNSENGEIIATDLTQEDINKILEVLDGEN